MIIRQTSAMNQLRIEVLQAKSLLSAGANAISIDNHIRWDSDAAGLHRVDGASDRHWIGVQLQLSIDDGQLLVHPAATSNVQPERLIPMNQWLSEARP